MLRRDFLRTAGSGALGLMASGYPVQGMAAESDVDAIYLGMTCTLVTMMLDGLIKKYRLAVKQ